MTGITCKVCPHACHLSPGEVGLCGARQGQVGRVASRNYGKCTALALDPIEKKPLARYYSGAQILSYGSYGCNLSCSFCQNWEIAQAGKVAKDGEGVGDSTSLADREKPPSRFISPDALVRQAVALKSKGNIGIALTYNEPLICPEYLIDVAQLAHAEGLKLVLVTNGYVMTSVAEQVFAMVDAANIDLKAFNPDFYTMVGAPAGLSVVKRTIQIALAVGCHVEVTTLVIPGLNSSFTEMREEVAWLSSLDPEITLHLTRFHPAYNMRERGATSPSLVGDLAGIAHEKLKHVYLGNR